MLVVKCRGINETMMSHACFYQAYLFSSKWGTYRDGQNYTKESKIRRGRFRGARVRYALLWEVGLCEAQRLEGWKSVEQLHAVEIRREV